MPILAPAAQGVRVSSGSTESANHGLVRRNSQTFPEIRAQFYLRAMQGAKNGENIRKFQRQYEIAKLRDDQFKGASFQSLKTCEHLEKQMKRADKEKGAQWDGIDSFALDYLDKCNRKRDRGGFKIKARDLRFE